MKTEIKRRTCDFCGKSEDVCGTRFGASPFIGWVEYSEHLASSVENRDFCCLGCLKDFVSIKMSSPIDEEVPF